MGRVDVKHRIEVIVTMKKNQKILGGGGGRGPVRVWGFGSQEVGEQRIEVIVKIQKKSPGEVRVDVTEELKLL